MRARGKNAIPIKERKPQMPSFGVRAKLNYPCQPRDKKPQEWIKKRGREGSYPVIVGLVLHLIHLYNFSFLSGKEGEGIERTIAVDILPNLVKVPHRDGYPCSSLRAKVASVDVNWQFISQGPRDSVVSLGVRRRFNAGKLFFQVTDASFLVNNWAEDDTRFQRSKKSRL